MCQCCRRDCPGADPAGAGVQRGAGGDDDRSTIGEDAAGDGGKGVGHQQGTRVADTQIAAAKCGLAIDHEEVDEVGGVACNRLECIVLARGVVAGGIEHERVFTGIPDSVERSVAETAGDIRRGIGAKTDGAVGNGQCCRRR